MNKLSIIKLQFFGEFQRFCGLNASLIMSTLGPKLRSSDGSGLGSLSKGTEFKPGWILWECFLNKLIQKGASMSLLHCCAHR